MTEIFQSVLTYAITPISFMLCLASSLIIGLLISLVYMKTNKRYSSGFVLTLFLIPAVVQIVIMLVNGNLGAGVAVAGAFSLIRFRSVPGRASEICSIFIALAAGLATGMGYLAFAGIFVVVTLLLCLLLNAVHFGEKATRNKKQLIITIPESLNYTNCFKDIFEKYTSYTQLVNVKTTNMGSLFKLTYEISLKNESMEKSFIDEIRCRNSNLEIICCCLPENGEVL